MEVISELQNIDLTSWVIVGFYDNGNHCNIL